MTLRDCMTRDASAIARGQCDCTSLREGWGSESGICTTNKVDTLSLTLMITRTLTPDMLIDGYTILASGIYTLTASAALLGVSSITIAASGVTLDLNGFNLEGSRLTVAIVLVQPCSSRCRWWGTTRVG